MKRFFSFGCSYTAYSWASWADILCYHYSKEGYKTYNFGRPGLGNVGIFYAMCLADLQFNFNDQDIIMVVWSSFDREDRFSRHRWLTGGSIYNNSFFDDHFIQKYVDVKNDIIKNSSVIIAANKQYNISFNGLVCPHENYDKILEYIKNEDPESRTSILEFLVSLENSELSFLNYKNSLNYYNYFYGCDGHEFPLMHLDYVKNIIGKYSKDFFNLTHHTISWTIRQEEELLDTILTLNKTMPLKDIGDHLIASSEISKYHCFDNLIENSTTKNINNFKNELGVIFGSPKIV